MADKLGQEVLALLRDNTTVKILATLDESGSPHAVVKQSLQADDKGNLIYLELLESSRTNKNLVRSIWFDQKVSVTLKGENGESWQIKGRPVKAHITGPLFQQHYLNLRRELGDVDLAAVWVIRPVEVIDESPGKRRQQEETAHPLFRHLDRLAQHSPM